MIVLLVIVSNGGWMSVTVSVNGRGGVNPTRRPCIGR